MTQSHALFVCTGNIFRSMTAEYALRQALGDGTSTTVGSAGLIEAPHDVLPFVREHLDCKGVDISGHHPRRLTAVMVEQADLIVAMSTDHQERLRDRFGLDAPLFNLVAGGENTALPDVWEVLPDWQDREDEAKAYAWQLMDGLFDAMPRFIERMGGFIE